MKEALLQSEVEIPQGVSVSAAGNTLTAKGKFGEATKKLVDPRIEISLEEGKVVISSKNATKREKTKLGTFRAHVSNLVKGAAEGFTYRLKICSGHFPMNVAVNGTNFVVKNYLGEKVPRVVKIKEGAKVVIDGTDVTVSAANKETAGQVAADIEQLCRITNRDRRIFQDGIYIVDKAGKLIG
ncbi:50S ribosomal protein L6 [Candidatus Woesearchaeota archaeon]|nr:50S ribosomal protein L6 [Candidatus Woesearchaeota archaeon]